MKIEEKIVISKQLAIDLIWWLEHADVPFNDFAYWNGRRQPTQMELARDSMVDELEKVLVAKQFRLTLEEENER